MVSYWYISPKQPETNVLCSVLQLSCTFQMNSSSSRTQREPRLALDLLRHNSGQAVVHLETTHEGIGLDEVDQHDWGSITIWQWTQQGSRLRKAVFIHKSPIN